MSELENKPVEPGSSPITQEPALREEGLSARLLQAGEWLERSPGKHMGLWTTLFVLLIMLVLVLIGSGQ